MSSQYEKQLIELFGALDVSLFRVNLDVRRFFVCGGLVDAGQKVPPSFRDRFLSFSYSAYPDVANGIILAESFNDYFKENAYPDLLTFEEEIASISSLVIIFLESPGSLVELGLFCTKPNFYKKILIVAPQEHVYSEDSFIFLGPLENIRKKQPDSVAVYPWPSDCEINYERDHLVDLCESIREKIRRSDETARFDFNDSGHLGLLISEIVKIAYPIIVSEIEICLDTLCVDVDHARLTRLIYLLERLKIIKPYPYSGYKYYYPARTKDSFVKFEQSKVLDASKARISVVQSFVEETDAKSRKRKASLRGISKLLEGDSNETG